MVATPLHAFLPSPAVSERSCEGPVCDLFAALGGPDFRKQQFGRELVFRPNALSPEAAQGLLDVTDVEALVHTRGVTTRQQIGTRHRDATMVRSLRSPGELYERLTEGASLQLRHLEGILAPSAPLSRAAQALEHALQHPLDSVSCFLTPPGSATLGLHHDATEIVTIQVRGTKRWRLYHRVWSPESGTHAADEVDAPEVELTLAPGDILYTPGGLIHEVEAADELSMSVTIVFAPLRWNILLNVLTERAARLAPLLDLVDLTAADANGSEALAAAFAARRDLLIEELERMNVDELAHRAREQLLTAMTWSHRPHLDDAFAAARIDLDTRLEHRFPCELAVCRRGGHVHLTGPGGTAAVLPAAIEPELRALAARRDVWPVIELSARLPETERVALARQLVRSGLIRIARGSQEPLP